MELIADHEHIQKGADMLLAELAAPHVQCGRVAQELHELAVFVRDHIAVEDAIVSLCDQRPLPERWRKAWLDGRPTFELLRADWTDFLDAWSAEAVKHDLDGFRPVAVKVLGRLKERVKLETEAFYAVALQTGAILSK